MVYSRSEVLEVMRLNRVSYIYLQPRSVDSILRDACQRYVAKRMSHKWACRKLESKNLSFKKKHVCLIFL